VADSISIQFFVEGSDEEEPQDFQKDSALFRMDGPVVFQGSSEEWYSIELQILLTDIVASTTDNAYGIYRWAGVFQGSMLNDTISILRCGNGPEDDDSLIGCLAPDPSVRNNIRLANYGVVDKDSRVRQMSINGKFLLCL
jgi:hypothetical protein